MPHQIFRVSFAASSPSEANRFATSLTDALQVAADDVQIERIREGTTQDLGTILSIVLGANSVIAVSRGVATWIARHNTSELIFEDSARKLHIKNSTPAEIQKAVESFLKA